MRANIPQTLIRKAFRLQSEVVVLVAELEEDEEDPNVLEVLKSVLDFLNDFKEELS